MSITSLSAACAASHPGQDCETLESHTHRLGKPLIVRQCLSRLRFIARQRVVTRARIADGSLRSGVPEKYGVIRLGWMPPEFVVDL